MSTWDKIMRYALEHNRDPDKYPFWHTPVEWSHFKEDLSSWISAFFTDSDSILGKFFLFLVNNPILVFLLGVGFAFGAFNILRSVFKTARWKG